MAPGVPTLQGAVSGLDWNLATCQKLGATEGRNLAAHTEQGPAPRDPPSPGCYLRRRTGTAGGSAARYTRTRSSAPAATPSGPPRTRSSRLPRTSTATAAPWGPRRRAPACACALQPRSTTAAPGSPICQLRLRRRSAATATPWEPSSRRLARLLTSPLWDSAGWSLGLLFPFCLPGYRSHVVPIQVLANRDWVVQCL